MRKGSDILTARQYFKAYVYDYQHKNELGLTDNALCSVIAEKFAAEVEQLIDWKVVTTTKQLMNALTERNEKWMALARIFKNNCGSSPIDGSYFRKKVIPRKWPEILKYQQMKKRGRDIPLNELKTII